MSGVIIFFVVIAVVGLIVGAWYYGYTMGLRDAYMDYFQKKEYYDWIMEVKRKQNWE